MTTINSSQVSNNQEITFSNSILNDQGFSVSTGNEVATVNITPFGTSTSSNQPVLCSISIGWDSFVCSSQTQYLFISNYAYGTHTPYNPGQTSQTVSSGSQMVNSSTFTIPPVSNGNTPIYPLSVMLTSSGIYILLHSGTPGGGSGNLAGVGVWTSGTTYSANTIMFNYLATA